MKKIKQLHLKSEMFDPPGINPFRVCSKSCNCFSNSYDGHCSQEWGTIAFIGASFKKKAPGIKCPVRDKDEAVIGVYIKELTGDEIDIDMSGV